MEEGKEEGGGGRKVVVGLMSLGLTLTVLPPALSELTVLSAFFTHCLGRQTVSQTRAAVAVFEPRTKTNIKKGRSELWETEV